MARDSALSALSTLPDVVACVASPRTDAGKKISCGRHDAQERQRHKAADGEQRHQIVVPGGGQVQDDFEDASMASTKFLMYSMCRGMRSLAMFMLAADSGRPSICVRCPVSTMPTRNWPCRWSATGSPMSPRRRRVSVFAEPTISRPYESGLVTPDMRVSGCNHYGYHAGKRLVIGNAWGYVLLDTPIYMGWVIGGMV